MMRFALKFRPLRQGNSSGGGGVTPVGSGSGFGSSIRRQCAIFCRRVCNDGSGRARCCSGSSLRDRLKLNRFRRSACQTGCTRAFLIVLNFAFLLCGCALVVFGLWLHVDRDSSLYLELLHSVPATGPLVITGQLALSLVAIGAGVSVVSFLGCCGACADSACFMCLYILLLMVVLLTEIIIGISTLAYGDQISVKLQSALQQQIRFEYNKTGRPIGNGSTAFSDHVTVTWDAMQIKLNCCGATGPLDYRYSAWYNRTRYIDFVYVPASCCLGTGLPVGTGSHSGLDGIGGAPVSAINGPPYVNYQLHHRHQFQQPGPPPQYQQHYQSPLAPSSQKPPVAPSVGEKDDSRLLSGQDNLCQVEATLIPEHPSSGPLVSRTHNLKTQGCQTSITNWFYSNMSSIATLSCTAFIIQVLNVFFACMLMTRLRQRHFEGSQWSDDSDVE